MDEELLERMNKKISQLTRVIYLLNTKNEESDGLIKSILNSYDTELENMRREATQVLGTMKEKIEKLKDTSFVDNKIKDIKRKYDDSVLKYSAGYESFKNEIKRTKDNLEMEYKGKYNDMIQEVSDIKKSADKRVSDFIKKNEEDKKRLIAEKEKEKMDFQNEIDNLKKSYENKISTLNKDHKKEIDQLKNDFNSQLKNLKDEYEQRLQDKDKMYYYAK